MGLTSIIKNWWTTLFNKARAFVQKMWGVAEPFIIATLSETARQLWQTSQGLLMDAYSYVQAQGLPTDDAKKEAFKNYMQEKSELALNRLKDLEWNVIREMGLAIWKKSLEK
jgi:hypothetical protein